MQQPQYQARRKGTHAIEGDAPVRGSQAGGSRRSSPAGAPSRAVSLPTAKSTTPAATAEAETLDEPSGDALRRVRSPARVCAFSPVGSRSIRRCGPCQTKMRARVEQSLNDRRRARRGPVGAQPVGTPKPVLWPGDVVMSLTGT